MEEVEKDEQGTDFEETNSWLKDNLRIIISIIIVVAIAGGVYSYSKRTQNVAVTESDTQITEEQAVEEESANKVEITEGQEAVKQQKQEQVTPATSQETDGSFIETAGSGDGKTHLARRALANYLEKNPDSALTAEHKIYVEDYLRKYSGSNGNVHVGTSVEFSKDLINKAIDSSKQLNDKQLQNLHKYVLRVPSLS